jgi:hypothetical protein
MVCKAGYFLNVDNICEQYKVPNQAVNNGVFINSYVAAFAYTGTRPSYTLANADDYSAYVRAHYLLSYKQLQYGVTACSSGYTLAPANPWAPRVCVWSSYVGVHRLLRRLRADDPEHRLVLLPDPGLAELRPAPGHLAHLRRQLRDHLLRPVRHQLRPGVRRPQNPELPSFHPGVPIRLYHLFNGLLPRS